MQMFQLKSLKRAEKLEKIIDKNIALKALPNEPN